MFTPLGSKSKETPKSSDAIYQEIFLVVDKALICTTVPHSSSIVSEVMVLILNISMQKKIDNAYDGIQNVQLWFMVGNYAI